MITNTLGERIKRNRLLVDMTQTQLAKAAHLSKGFLSDIENGKRDMSIKKFLGVANALGTDIKELLTGIMNQNFEISYSKTWNDGVKQNGTFKIEAINADAACLKFWQTVPNAGQLKSVTLRKIKASRRKDG